ncbi:hypothetical protein [Rhizobium sp. Root651]|uniref:hypothetical protein n=1 Tax=Rhizobium sp. Root651 TaxID=1736577 RepID=UPI000A5C64B5|nr:hypothetical protein [Rhizobium sp. Root651]
MLTNNQIEIIFPTAGPIWRPDQTKKNRPDTPEGFALQFTEYFTPLLGKVVQQKAPRISVQMALFENPDMNAFAGGSDQLGFVIGTYKGLIETLLAYYYNKQNQVFVSQKFPLMSKLSPDTLSLYSCFFATTYIFFHEFSHVFRGHLGYRSTLGINGSQILEVNAWSGGSQSDRQIYLTECDADIYGGRFTAAAMLEQLPSLIREISCVDETALRSEILSFCAFSIQSLFRLFETTQLQADPHYPPHRVRSAIVLTQLVRGLKRMQLGRHGSTPQSTSHEIVSGIRWSNELADIRKLREFPVDAGAAADDWEKKDAPDVTALSRKIAPYRPGISGLRRFLLTIRGWIPF